AALQPAGARCVAVGGFGPDRHPGLVQDEPDPAADQRLVVGDDHAERSAGRGCVAHGGGTSPGICAGSTGMLALTSHPPPGRGPAARSPPQSAPPSPPPSQPLPPPRATPPPPAPRAPTTPADTA